MLWISSFHYAAVTKKLLFFSGVARRFRSFKQRDNNNSRSKETGWKQWTNMQKEKS